VVSQFKVKLGGLSQSFPSASLRLRLGKLLDTASLLPVAFDLTRSGPPLDCGIFPHHDIHP
jgi:hypothetical protein